MARAAVAGLGLVCLVLVFLDWWICLPDGAVATYVGRQSCIPCHEKEVQAWTGSHHDLAMDRATPQTVLGDFDNAEFTQFGITSRMYRSGEKFMIRTEGPDGRMQDFEIKYVFGVTPLQNYMVEFDRTPDMREGEIGRLQVLRVTWDTRRKEWFYLAPPDVAEKLSPDDELHWTRIGQCWNHMCADCHSTNLQKNYDLATGRYRTTFSEIDVSCETCHGPASLHVELSRQRIFFWDRKRGYGLPSLKSSDARVQIHSCAPCHSRRRLVYPGYRPGEDYYDYYANELLQAETYHADGQILDEVYEFASFLQSKMYHKGIRCTDCHDPHTLRLKHGLNLVCTSCHQHPAGKYDVVAHHRHNVGSSATLCVECHMRATSYMAVDPRRDHSFRNPRPDLSVQLGTPNACSGCHLEQAQLAPEKAAQFKEYADWLTAARRGDAEVRKALARVDRWSAERFREWYGEKEDAKTHFSHTLAAAHRGEPSAEKQLIALVKDRRLPAVVRATGLLELEQFSSPQVADACAELLQDPDPQVRMGAIANQRMRPGEALVKLVAPALADPIRAVRTEAGRVLARVPASLLRGSERRLLEAALREYEEGLLATGERAAAHLTLALLYEDVGDAERARKAYATAIRVEPQVSGPRTNLAALLDRLADEEEQRGGAPSPAEAAPPAEQAGAYRQEASRLRKEELELLARDARLAPHAAAIQYRYGLSLYLHGRLAEAEQALRKAAELAPNTPDFVLALALLCQKQQRLGEAVQLVRRLVALRPSEPTYRQLLEDLLQQAGK